MVGGAECEQSLIIEPSWEITAKCLPAKLAPSLSAGKQSTQLPRRLLWKLFQVFLEDELFVSAETFGCVS